MVNVDPEKQQAFAVEVVRQLREHGFQAYWAGGCVRDHLLSRTPYDYDVATSAHPEEIRNVFRHRKTLAVGAAFGVMTVVGPRGAGQVEVTTFRQDVGYSDGRHPDRIAFSSPEEDARRRDFTINGMFFDPLAGKVIDFVDGQADLERHTVRAIGDPRQRFTEDKLRMLRAVRFASVFNFEMEPNTLAAISEMAPQITVVSAERIAGEMRIVLVLPARVRAVQLLRETGLLSAILPEAAALEDGKTEGDSPWHRTIGLLGAITEPSFPLALSTLLHLAKDDKLAETVGRRWRLARAEIDRMAWLLMHQHSLVGAAKLPWSKVQPLLVDPGADELIKFHEAQTTLGHVDPSDCAFCRRQLQRPIEELDPSPLVKGDDLIALGLKPGPLFAELLTAARRAQLDGAVGDRDAALEFVRNLWRKRRS